MIVVSKKWKLQSSGTQAKWHNPVTDLFYKADDKKSYGGCEGLAETICSDLLDKSNIGLHANYRPVRIQSGLHIICGCESPNFRTNHNRFLTAADIVDGTTFDPERLRKEQSTNQTIQDFIQLVKQKTNGYDISTFLCKLLEFDQLVLNIDRNLGNIGLLKRPDGTYLPIAFDHGRSFMTNELLQHPDLSMDTISNLAFSVPFSKTYPLQVHAIEQICDVSSLFRTRYTMKDLDISLDKCRQIYPDNLIERIRDLFLYQMERHSDYFLTEEREQSCKDYSELVQNQCSGFSVEEKMDEHGFPLGDLTFTWKKDTQIRYELSVQTKKFLSLSEHLAFPLTPPDQVEGSDREEIQLFLSTIREFMTQERDQELER